MNLIPFVELLEMNALGQGGVDIFVNMMPMSCEQGILLKNGLRGTVIDYELPGYFRTKFQAIVRCADYITGELMMESVLSALTLQERALGQIHYIFCRPITQPISFPLSDGNLLELSVEFDVVFYEIK